MPSVATLTKLKAVLLPSPGERPAAGAVLAAVTERLTGLETSGRSATLLLEQIATVRGTAQWMRALRREPWTARRFGLLDLACTTARELVVDGRLTLADWLATQILAADPDIRRAHEVRALVAVEFHRPVRARKHYARCIRREGDAPQVRQWLRAQHARMAARAVFGELAHGVDAPDGGAVQLWQAGLASDDAVRRDRLQALAVAEACRPGDVHDGALWCRRYLLERSADTDTDTDTVVSIRRRLDAEEQNLRTTTNGAPASSRATPRRPAAQRPQGTASSTIVLAFHLDGPKAECDLPTALAEARATLADIGCAADLVVVHGGLDPVTINAAFAAAPDVRFVEGDVRRWSGLPVTAPIARRLVALDAVGLRGYDRVVLTPIAEGVGAHLAEALRDDRNGTLSATALRDDVVATTNLVVVDAELTGGNITAALDAAALREFGVDRFRDSDANAAWRVLTTLRDELVTSGALPPSAGFSSYRVPGATSGAADDVELLAGVIAQADSAGVCELFEREVHHPYQLTDRVLLRWAHALHACSRYDRALEVLAVCGERDDADIAAASTAWVLHDRDRGAAFARDLQLRNPDHPRAAQLGARFRAPEPTLPAVGTPLVHVAAYVGKGGNYGDRVLPIAVRRAVSSVTDDPLGFVSVQAHQLFDDSRRELADRSAGVIVGGGGLFLPDTAPNGNSGWQWNVPAEQLDLLDVPLAVVAVGFNLFRGQAFSGNLFIDNLARLIDRADVVGLRNHGSIAQVRTLLPAHLAAKVEYLPCPTTVLAHLDPSLSGPVERDRSVLINAAYDRSSLRFGDSYDAFLAQIAGYVTALQQDEVDVRIVSHMAPDEQLAADLRAQYDLELPLLRLNHVTLEEAYRMYREAGVVVGMRGHATMIPFGLRTPVLSLVSHPKMRYFLDDVAHPEWGFEIAEPFEHALLERTRHTLADPAAYVEDIVTAQDVLLDAVQAPLRRFMSTVTG